MNAVQASIIVTLKKFVNQYHRGKSSVPACDYGKLLYELKLQRTRFGKELYAFSLLPFHMETWLACRLWAEKELRFTFVTRRTGSVYIQFQPRENFALEYRRAAADLLEEYNFRVSEELTING